MSTPSNGFGSGPDEEPRYGVRVPGAQNNQDSDTSRAQPQPQGWDTPRGPYSANQGQAPGATPGQYPGQPGHQNFGPYVPDDYRNSRGGYLGKPYPGARPGQVKAASIILWITAGLYTVMMAFSMIAVMGMDLKSMILEQSKGYPEQTREQMEDMLDTYGTGAFQGFFVATFVLIIIVGVLAAVAAWRTWKGSNAWRIAGTVCGIGMGVFQIMMVLTSPVAGLPGLAICVIVLVLWYSKPAKAFFQAKSNQQRRY